MNFGRILSNLRKEKKMTQNDLAKAFGISRGTIGMYEIGKNDPDTSTLVKLADYFDVSVDFLLGRSEIRKPQESKCEGNAYHCFDVSSLPEEAIKQIEEYVKLIKLKYSIDRKDE